MLLTHFTPISSPSSPMSLTLSSPAIMTQTTTMNIGNNAAIGSKRGRLLIRQQRVKKDGDQGGDLETPEAGVYSDYLLSTSSGVRMERHASEPSPATSSLAPSQIHSGQNLLSVPTHSSYLVKQHSHPLLPSQSSSPSSSYTLTRQLSYPTQPSSHSQTVVTTVSSHEAQEIVASGQLLQLQHHKPPVRSHTMPQYTITEMDMIGSDKQMSGSPSVVIIPDVTSDQASQHSAQTQQQPPHQKQLQHHLQLPSIRVKSDELQRSISSPLSSTRSDLSFETATRSSHCPTLRPGPALGCNFCWNTIDAHGRILRRKTKYHCPECQTNLCIVPCFQEYHERQTGEGGHDAPITANKTGALKGLKSSSL